MPRTTDAIKTYQAVRANGWGWGDAAKAASIVFSSGGLRSAISQNYWPNTFRKLTDPWPVRAGLDTRTLGTDAFCRNSTVQACLGWIQRNFTEARICVVEGTGDDAEEIEDHPLTALLSRPNDFYTPDLLWEETLDDWWVSGRGNAYWLKEMGRTGEPSAIYPVPACEMLPIRPKDGSRYLSHYERTVDGKPVRMDTEQVVHFRFGRDPANPLLGYSPLVSGAAEVGMLNEGAGYRSEILARHGIVPYALTPKDQATADMMDPEKTEALNKVFQRKFGRGGDGASLFIPNFMADLTRMGFSPQEMDIRAMLEWDSSTICALFGLNAMVVGLPSGDGERTFSNQGDAREAAVECNIVPTQDRFAATIERFLGRDFGLRPDEHVVWDRRAVRVLQEDENKKWERANRAWATGAITRAQFKQAVGLEVEEAADEVYFVPNTGALTPADQTPEDAAAEMADQAQPAEAPAPESPGDAAVTQMPPPNGAVPSNGTKSLPLPRTVRIDSEDVAAAVVLWDETMPGYEGILQARQANGKS